MRYYLQKIAMRAGNDERMINYEWPNKNTWKSLDDENLKTLMTKVEAVINSRTLTVETVTQTF